MPKKNSSSEILRRSYKILGLALLFFLFTVGLLGRWWWQTSHDTGFGKLSLTAGGYAPGSISGEKPVVLTTGPEPAKFLTLTWPLQKDLVLAGECRDQYYTVLIYPESRDYRQDPTTNVYNRAVVCTKGEAWQNLLTTENLQLATGTYYLLRADQGAEGSWYNPY